MTVLTLSSFRIRWSTRFIHVHYRTRTLYTGVRCDLSDTTTRATARASQLCTHSLVKKMVAIALSSVAVARQSALARKVQGAPKKNSFHRRVASFHRCAVAVVASGGNGTDFTTRATPSGDSGYLSVLTSHNSSNPRVPETVPRTRSRRVSRSVRCVRCVRRRPRRRAIDATARSASRSRGGFRSIRSRRRRGRGRRRRRRRGRWMDGSTGGAPGRDTLARYGFFPPSSLLGWFGVAFSVSAFDES